MTNLLPVDQHFADLPVSDRGVRRVGLAIILVTFGLFGGWAALAPLDSAALASGVVMVQNYRKTVQHLEGGIVRELLVHDGDQVTLGQPLIVLDDTQLRAEFDMTRSQLVAAQATQSRLEAERDDRPAINFSAMLEQDTPRALEAKDSETQVFRTRRSARLGEIAVLEKRVGQLREQINGLGQMIQTKGGLDKSYAGEIGELSELLAEGFVDKQRLLDQERKRESLKSEVDDHRSEIIKTRLQINETELQILQLKKDFSAEVVSQLAEIQTRVFDLQERMAALQDRIERSVIRAPESGMVLDMKVHTIGGVVSPATPLLDVVPLASDLVVEAQVSPLDIDRVTAGKSANIRFTAFSSRKTPDISGTVLQVSADRLVDEHTGNPYYLARVGLTEEGTRQLAGLDLRLQPGMPADVLINTGERTLLEYLLQPATDAFARSLIEE